MENQLQVFKNYEFGQVRVFNINGEPWFVGKDIADILGYKNSRDALNKHTDIDERDVAKCDTLGGEQNLLIINESGLYSLVLSSKLENAKRFKKWVTSDVLPTLRKTGQYQMLPSSYADALRELAATVEEKEKLEEQNKLMAPKVEFYDSVAGSKDAIEMAHAAKVLSIKGFGRNNLFDFLREKEVLDKNNIPYQRFIDSGYFRTIEQKYNTPKGEIKINIKTLVYQKGLDYIRKLIEKEKSN